MTETKKRVQNQHPQKRDVNAAQRVTLALKLRAAKVGYVQIAQQCGYGSPGAAHKAIMRELERTISENTDELRREELATLDKLQQECFTRMVDKNFDKSMLFAIDRILAIMERRARLMGLDKNDDNVIGAQIIVQEIPSGYLGVEAPKV